MAEGVQPFNQDFDVPTVDFNDPDAVNDCVDDWFDTDRPANINVLSPELRPVCSKKLEFSNSRILRRSPCLARRTIAYCTAPYKNVGHPSQFLRQSIANCSKGEVNARKRHTNVEPRLYLAKKRTSDIKHEDFVTSLRKYKQTTKKQTSGVTRAMPFSFCQTNKQSQNVKQFRSMAEQIREFEQKTPPRFRQRRTGLPEKTEQSLPIIRPTVPLTPRLLTSLRSRGATTLSQAEKENLDVESMKRFQFKANSIKANLYKDPAFPKLELKPLTISSPFNFALNDRQHLTIKDQENTKSQSPFKFTAKPFPVALFRKPKVTVTSAKPIRKRLSINIKQRLRSWKRQSERGQKQAEQQESQSSSVDLPRQQTEPFVLKLDHKATKVSPFRFDERNKQLAKRKEERMQVVIEEEKKLREFYAKPLPSFNVTGLPEKKKAPATQLAPFNLCGEEFTHKKQLEFQEKIAEERKLKQAQLLFKAKPFESAKPFIPQQSQKPVTVFEEFELQTVKRAVEREAYDERMKAKRQMKEEEKQQEQKLQEENECQEYAKLRRLTIHKAQPVRHYGNLQIVPGNRPTTPKSPAFSTRKRKWPNP